MKDYLKILYISALPTFLVFAGKGDYLSTFLDSHGLLPGWTTKAEFEFVLFTLGIVWSGIVIPAQLVIAKKEVEAKNNTLKSLLEFNKGVFMDNLRGAFKIPVRTLRTRIFVPTPKPPLHKSLWNKVRGKDELHFVLKEVQGISDSFDAAHLTFQVNPKAEGLVGKAYSDKKQAIDSQVKSSNYNLNYYQKSNTSDVEFCCASPIFNKNNEVVAVLSVDSNEKCFLDQEGLRKWEASMNLFCSFVDKHTKF